MHVNLSSCSCLKSLSFYGEGMTIALKNYYTGLTIFMSTFLFQERKKTQLVMSLARGRRLAAILTTESPQLELILPVCAGESGSPFQP